MATRRAAMERHGGAKAPALRPAGDVAFSRAMAFFRGILERAAGPRSTLFIIYYFFSFQVLRDRFGGPFFCTLLILRLDNYQLLEYHGYKPTPT